MEDLEKTFQDLANQITNLKTKYMALGQEIMTKKIAAFFEQYPEVGGVAWKQYTPYFNDGDACEFSVGEKVFYPSEELATQVFGEDYDPDEYEDTYYDNSIFDKPSAWLYEKYPNDETIVNRAKLTEILGEARLTEIQDGCASLQNLLFSIDDDIMLDLYGDHVKVYLDKTGATVDEYNHD